MINGLSRNLRVLQVLQSLSASEYPQTLSQLSSRTKLPKSSLMRLLAELERHDYVTRTPGQGGYVTGPRCHELGLSIVQTPSLLRRCSSIIRRLVAITGETCNLNILTEDHVQYLVRVENPGQLRLQLHMEIGSRVPLHCTASGKLFLAMTPEPAHSQMISQLALERYAPQTITNRQDLEQELKRTQALKLGLDNEEFVRGMVAVAVPVHNDEGQTIAALACHAPTAQATLEYLIEQVPAMRRTANELQEILSASN